MPILTESDVRNAAQTVFKSNRKSYYESFADFAERDAREHEKTARHRSRFDVFLSHSFRDKELILGLRDLLERKGLAVYVDWIDDPQLDRASVSPAAAALIQRRMKQSTTLLYATSKNAADSKWMPWELGYFDGLKGKVGVVPITPQASRSAAVPRQEYLGLYPYVGPCSTYADASELCLYDDSGAKTPLKQWTGSTRTFVVG